MMSGSRLVASQIVALVALGLALLNDLGLAGELGLKLAVTGISALLLALFAFFMALRTGSMLVSASLSLQGLSNVASAVNAGASIGIPFGLVVLFLGIVKLVITLRAKKAAAGASPSEPGRLVN